MRKLFLRSYLKLSLAKILAKAGAGDVRAQYEAADRYSTGRGEAPADPLQAERWLRTAADQGHPLAQARMGVTLYNDADSEEERNECVEWFKAAAEQGVPFALYALSRVYDEGFGTAKDASQAHKYLEEAAEAGSNSAILTLIAEADSKDAPARTPEEKQKSETLQAKIEELLQAGEPPDEAIDGVYAIAASLGNPQAVHFLLTLFPFDEAPIEESDLTKAIEKAVKAGHRQFADVLGFIRLEEQLHGCF